MPRRLPYLAVVFWIGLAYGFPVAVADEGSVSAPRLDDAGGWLRLGPSQRSGQRPAEPAPGLVPEVMRQRESMDLRRLLQDQQFERSLLTRRQPPGLRAPPLGQAARDLGLRMRQQQERQSWGLGRSLERSLHGLPPGQFGPADVPAPLMPYRPVPR